MLSSSHRIRLAAGAFGGALLLAEGAVHSMVGWPSARRDLLSAHTPPPLVDGLVVPWHLAGTAMALVGLLAVVACLRSIRGREGPLWPVRLVGVTFLGFGAAGAVLIRPDPTFALFAVPGLLCAVAPSSIPSRSDGDAR